MLIGIISQPRRGDAGDGRRYFLQTPSLGKLGDAAKIGNRDFGVADGIGGEFGGMVFVHQIHSCDTWYRHAALVDDIGHLQFLEADQVAEVLQLAGAAGARSWYRTGSKWPSPGRRSASLCRGWSAASRRRRSP